MNQMQLWLVARGWRGHGAGEPAHAVLRPALCCFSRWGIVQGRTISPRATSHSCTGMPDPFRKAEHRGLSQQWLQCIDPLLALNTSANRLRHHALGHDPQAVKAAISTVLSKLTDSSRNWLVQSQ